MIPAGNIIDKSIFNHTLKVIGIRIPSTKTSAYLNVIGPRLLKQRNYKPIQKISESQRLVLLDPKTWPNQQSVLAVEPLAELIKADSAELAEHDIEVNYDSHDLDSALRIALPPDTPEIISSFETVGHLIHVNLKPWLLPYKYIIGRLILDKTKGVRTVMNKTDNITNQFRVFPMELIAGEDDTNVEVNESGCRFRFDYGRVYWNSKLQHEHDRLVQLILQRKRPIVADMFAGVGPFTIPLAKARRSPGFSPALVYANDLNPDSYLHLTKNVTLNHVPPQNHIASNLDGREFLVDLVRHKGVRPTDIIMNLPASATDFLDVFRGLYLPTDSKDDMPTIHCYTFEMEEDHEKNLTERVETMIGTKLADKPFIFNVRNIAPKKNMYCVSFNLPETIERQSAESDPAAELPSAAKKTVPL